MNFDIICEIILDKNDTDYIEKPTVQTLFLRDACVYYKRWEILYLDREHTITEYRGINTIARYINRITHEEQKIKILYINYLEEEDKRVNNIPLKDTIVPSIKTELSIRIRPGGEKKENN